MALFNKPEYNARQRAGTPPRVKPPLQIPNFGEGPVGDIDVGGVRTSPEQLRAEYLRSLNDGAFAQQRLAESQRVAAERERNRLIAEGKAAADIITARAKEQAGKFAIASSLRAEAQKFGPRGVGVLKVPPVAKPYEVQSRNGITRERLLETADWVEQNYNESEFKADPSKRDAFMTELTQRVTGKDAVAVASPQSKFGQVKSPTDLIRAARDTLQEQTLKALEPAAQDYGKTSKFNPYDSSQYVRREVNVPVSVEGKAGGDLPVWLYDIISNAYGKVYPNAPTRGNQYFYEGAPEATLARFADTAYTGDEESQKRAVASLKAADLLGALRREGYNVENFNSIPSNVLDFLADEKQQGNYAFDLRNFFGGDFDRTLSDAAALTVAATKVNSENFLKAYQDSLPPGPRSRNFVEGFVHFLKTKGGEALGAALRAPVTSGARGGAAGVTAAETTSAVKEDAQQQLTVGELISFLSEPVNRLAWTPYYTTQLAADKGKSPWGALGLGLKALVSGFSPYEAGGEDKQIIQSVDTYEERQVLREQGLLNSFGENLMYDIRKLAVWLGTGKTDGGRYDVNLSNSPFLLGGAGYVLKALLEAAPDPVSGLAQTKWSGAVDGLATVAFDPVSWTPFIAARIGGKPLQLAAKMGTRTIAAQVAEREAVKLTQAATMNAALSAVGQDSVSLLSRAAASGRRVLSIAQDEAYRLSSKGKAWLRPSTVFKDTTVWTQKNATDAVAALSVGQQARVSAEKVGRAAYLTYGTGRNYINAIEEVIDTVGPNIKLLEKKLPSVPNAIIQDAVDAIVNGRKVIVNGVEHSLTGLDAAMLVIRDAVVTGKMNPKITLRRQVVAGIDDNLRRIPGVSNVAPRATATTGLSGRSVPFLFGASPVKPNAGRLTLALEKGAGRITSLFSPLVSIGVPNKVNEFALRMQQQLSIPQAVIDDIVRKADEEFGDDVATRLARLFEIGQQNADQLPGLDLLVTDLSIGLRGLDVPIQLKTVRNLEVAVELTLNSADETIANAGSHFVAEISGKSLSTKNTTKGAETRANAVLGRAKVLTSAADEIPPPSRGGLTGSVIKGTKVKTFNRQRAMIETEANRISEKITSGAKITSRDTHRLSLIEKLTAAINGVVNLAERRRMLYEVYQVNTQTIQDTFDKAIEVAGKNLDDAIEGEEVLKGVVDNFSGRETLTDFETEYLAKVREELEVAKTSIDTARTEVKELKAMLAFDLAALKSQWQKEARMLDGLESRWSKEVAAAETDLRRFGAQPAKGVKESTPVERVLAVSGANPETFEDALLARVAAIYQDIGLTTIKPLGEEFDEVLTAAVTPTVSEPLTYVPGKTGGLYGPNTAGIKGIGNYADINKNVSKIIKSGIKAFIEENDIQTLIDIFSKRLNKTFNIPKTKLSESQLEDFIDEFIEALNIDDVINRGSVDFVTPYSEADLLIAVNDNTIFSILKDGRFKNQHEVGRSGGYFNPEARVEAEAAQFGVPVDLPPEKRPIYGFIKSLDNSTGEEVQKDINSRIYGNVRVKLKPEVKNRTTVTFGDSLEQARVGIPLTPEKRAEQIAGYFDYARQTDAPLASFSDESKLGRQWIEASIGTSFHTEARSRAYARVLQEFPEFKTMLPEPEMFRSGSAGHYVETQIHNGVSLSDIESIIIPEGMAEDTLDAIRKMAEPLGIKVGTEQELAGQVLKGPDATKLDYAGSVPIDVTEVEVANVIGGTIENPGRSVLYARINKLPPAVRDRFIDKVDKAVKSGKDLSAIARDVETLLAQPSFAKVVAEQIVHEDSLAAWLVQNYPVRQAAATVKRGAVRKVGRGLAKIPLSVIESVAPATIRFASSDNPYVSMQNRVEDIDRIAADYGFDQATRNLIALAAIEARSQDELFDLLHEMQRVWAIHMDIPYKDIMKAQNSKSVEFYSKFAYSVDSKGNTVTDLQMSAQRGNMLPILSASDARGVAAKYIAKSGKDSQFGVGTRFAASNRVRFDAAARGKLGKTGRFIHKFWKFSAITGIPAVGVGVVGGFIAGDPYEDGLMGWDSFQWAAIGGLIGSLGGIRYIGRVAGIEEALIRYPMVRGFNPMEYIPGLSKMKANWGVSRPNHHWDELVGSVRHPMNAGETNKLLKTIGEDWVSIDSTDKNFIDAWMRAVNRQVQPDVYLIDRLLLENFDDLQKFRELAIEYFKTDLGKVELRRLSSGVGAAKNVDEILTRMQNFVGKYLPTLDLRMQRLGAGIDGVARETFEQHLAAGTKFYPKNVHVRQQWIVPKSWKQLKATALQVYPRLVMEVPTTKFNRKRLAENISGSEYRRMIKAGIDETTAKNLAESYSFNLTNKVMFQLSDESRFADSVDYVFPFQQPREELLRVYGMLAVQNPARVWSMTEIGARAFNNGVESGIFYEDAFGEWRMRVPGSVWLSEMMGGPAGGFDFKVRDAFFLLQGNAFAVGSQSPDFTLDSPINLLMNTLPAPGGPYWSAAVRFAANQFPDVFTELSQNHGWIYNRLFPYGIDAAIGSPNLNRFYMGFFHSAPPWEFSNQKEQAERLKLIEIDIYNQLLYENRDDPDYLSYIQTPKGKKELDDEVYKRVTGLFLTWTVVASVTPAAAQPILPGKKENADLISRLRKQFGDGWYDVYVTTRPDLAAIYGISKYKNSEDLSFEQWKNTSGVDAIAKSTDRVVAYSLDEYMEQMQKARVSIELSKELDDAYNGFYLTESDRYQSVAAIEKKYSDLDTYKIDFRNSYYKKKELARIVYTLDASEQENALDEWRSHFEVSFPEYKSLLKTIREFTFDARKEARDIQQILEGASDASGQLVGPMGVMEAGRSGLNREAYVKTLPAAEQEKYWQYVMSTITYTDISQSDIEKYGLSTAEFYAGNNAISTLGYWEKAKRALDLVYATNKDLFNKSNLKVPSPTDEMAKAIRDGAGAYLDAVNLKLVDARAARDNAYNQKDWSTYRAARDRVNSLSSEKRAILGDLYKKYTNLEQFQTDLKSMFYLQNNPDKKSSQKSAELYERRMAELGIPTFAFDSEEKNYIKMSTDVRGAYRRSLITRLNFDKGDNGKLHWEHLTPFQKDLLEKMALPEEQLELWKKDSYSSGSGSSGSSAASDLQYAYSLMEKYNRRPAGAKAPAAYNEYLKIPNSDSVSKSNFLKQNPEVADWIKLGPLANMPELDRLIVVNIMVKNGKWEGDVMDETEITNLAWAREQLKMWSRRTGDKPVTYDLWLNMPSGLEKAEYLRLHPEIKDWISKGPMSNMPDNYREVVRDIMYRFGEWSASTDPLGETITAFYSQPASKRQAFLDAHPELIEYWKAIRTPEEQRMADLAEAYFKIPDGTARRVFINAHPELNDYFIESRTKRYEKFMNKVAIYMGSNPSVFKEYLDRQEGLLNELLERFATPPMVREVVSKAPKSSGYGTSGRVRSVSGTNR